MNRQNYRAAFDAVDFSPDFEARMATLLRRQRRRRHWRALLAAAAVLGALAAGLSVGAGDRTDCQIYWSQTDGELRYVIRLEHTTDHLHIALRSVDGKVNLDDSCIMRKLRHILSNG